MLYECGRHGDPRTTKFVCFNNHLGRIAYSLPIEWCQTLTLSSRQRAARTFLAHQQTFITSVINYVQGMTGGMEEDRKALRELWQSQMGEIDDEEEDEEEETFDPFCWLRQDVWAEAEDRTMHIKKKRQTAKVNILGEPIGITLRLTMVCFFVHARMIRSLIHTLFPGL